MKNKNKNKNKNKKTKTKQKKFFFTFNFYIYIIYFIVYEIIRNIIIIIIKKKILSNLDINKISPIQFFLCLYYKIVFNFLLLLPFIYIYLYKKN